MIDITFTACKQKESYFRYNDLPLLRYNLQTYVIMESEYCAVIISEDEGENVVPIYMGWGYTIPTPASDATILVKTETTYGTDPKTREVK